MTTPADLPELPRTYFTTTTDAGWNRVPAYTAEHMRAFYAAGVRAGMERAALIANSCECGDGSHDYNAGAATMQDNIDAAIRAAQHTKQQTE